MQHTPACRGVRQLTEASEPLFCGGFYDLDESPEPPWTFDIADPDEALRLAGADSSVVS